MDIDELELELDLDYLDSMSHDETKREHRKSRKAKRKKKKTYVSVNKCIGKYASAYGKKMLHRIKRRELELNASDYYKHNDYSYSSILWDMT